MSGWSFLKVSMMFCAWRVASSSEKMLECAIPSSIQQTAHVLLRSTMARSAPLMTRPSGNWLAWHEAINNLGPLHSRPITKPNPLAPPVTTPTLPCNEKVASVGKIWAPARSVPSTGTEAGSWCSGGYSTVMESSVRAKAPAVGTSVASSADFFSVTFCVFLLSLLLLLLLLRPLPCWRDGGTVWNPATAWVLLRSRACRSRLGVVFGVETGTLPRIRGVGVRPAALRRIRPTGRDMFIVGFKVVQWCGSVKVE